jgi:hypothetical protein
MSPVAARYETPHPDGTGLQTDERGRTRITGEPEVPSIALRLATGQVSGRTSLIGWAAFALGVVLLCGQFWQGINPQDEGEMLTYPWLISQGRVPYAHLWIMYPPGSFVVLAGLFKIGIPGLIAERGLGLIARITLVLLANRTMTGSWRRCSLVGMSLALSFAFLTANISLAAYAWIVGLPVLFAGLLAVRSGRLGPAALAFGLAAGFRLEFGVAGALSLASFAMLSWCNGRRELSIWRPVLALCAGVVAFYLLLDLVTGGRALQDILIDPVVHIEPYRRIPLFPPRFGLFGVPAALCLLIGPPVLAVLAWHTRNPPLAATSLAICALLPQVLQDADWGHLFGVAAIGIPWVVVGLLDLYRADQYLGTDAPAEGARGTTASMRLVGTAIRAGATTGALYSLFVIAYCLIASPLSPASSVFLGNGPVHVIGSGQRMIIARTAAEANDGSRVVAYLRDHRARGGKVYVSSSALLGANYNMTVLYYALGETPASMYLETNPGLQTRPTIQRDITRELHQCEWVILWKDPAQPHVRTATRPALERYIQHAFHQVMANGTYEILERW